MANNTAKNTNITEELKSLDRAHYLHPTTVPFENPRMIFSEGNGIHVTNSDGERYIDAISMLWNVNLGHGRTDLADAGHAQMSRLAFSSSFAGYSNEPAIRLAAKLADWAPAGLETSFFTSGGSESNDTAFKLARFYWSLQGQPGKKKLISFKQGYHGVTIGAGTATTIKGFNRFSGAEMDDVLHATPHLTNCERGDRTDSNYKESVRHLIEQEGADSIAALIIEPIQGSGGVHIPPEGYMQALRDLCDEFDILFIADEVITGFGRTGEKFAVSHWDVTPDLLSLAKGITSGYAQLGAVMIHDRIRAAISEYDQVLGHGFTYSGHPSACAVALKNLEAIENEGIIDHVQKMENVLNDGFAYLHDKHKIVHLTRNKGLLGAFELFKDREKGERFDPELKVGPKFVDHCFDNKIILRVAGVPEGKAIIAIAPPLIISKEEIETLISVLDHTLTAFAKTL